MIIIYSGPVSWFSRKVEIALREKNLPFRQEIVPFTQTRGYFDRPEPVVRINPRRQVPVVIDGDLELYDSTVICEYLEDAYPVPPLLPRDTIIRAHCRQWDVFGDEVMLEPIRKLMHRTEPHDHTSARWLELEQVASTAGPAIAAHFDQIEHHLAGKRFLCGDFSLADIATFMAVFWSNRLGGPGFGDRTNLRRWYRATAVRPSVAVAIAEMAAQDNILSAPVSGAFADC
jgi:glutathione S-transferase